MSVMLRVMTDPRCLSHRSPPGYPERPERVAGIVEALAANGRTIVEPEVPQAEPGERAREMVLSTHDPTYVRRFEEATARGDGLLDSADNPLSTGTWSAAWAAVECALDAVDWVAEQPEAAAFVATRPPGHHAERATAMGFCYFNNIAVAAEYLLRQKGFERLAIVDFDVHHGNGTQHLFEERSDVLFVSLHQFPFYPGTGAASEVGLGAGRGATLNVPMEVGCGDDDYQRAFEETVLPAIAGFAPEILLISAGFDAWEKDPLGGMRVSAAGFESWGRMLAEAARSCRGGSLSVLEGGYDLGNLGLLAERYLAGLEMGLGS